jgi:hypothetical protein
MLCYRRSADEAARVFARKGDREDEEMRGQGTGHDDGGWKVNDGGGGVGGGVSCRARSTSCKSRCAVSRSSTSGGNQRSRGPKGPKGPSTAALKALWLLAGLTSAPTLEPPGARGVIRLRPVWPPDRAWRCRDPRYQSTRGPCKPQLLLKPVNKTPDKRATVVFLR